MDEDLLVVPGKQIGGPINIIVNQIMTYQGTDEISQTLLTVSQNTSTIVMTYSLTSLEKLVEDAESFLLLLYHD